MQGLETFSTLLTQTIEEKNDQNQIDDSLKKGNKLKTFFYLSRSVCV
jgi:hypothetical protein